MSLKPAASGLAVDGLKSVEREKQLLSSQAGPCPASAAPEGFPWDPQPAGAARAQCHPLHPRAGWGGPAGHSGCASIEPQPPGPPSSKELSPGAALWALTAPAGSCRFSLPKKNWPEKKASPFSFRKKGFEFHLLVPWGQTEGFLSNGRTQEGDVGM